MKKAIKIFSILCAILVAVFTATFFNSYKVSADSDPLFTYQDENVNISQDTEIDLSIYFYNANQYDNENIGGNTYFKFKTNLNNEIMPDITGKKFDNTMLDLMDITENNEYITELISYKVYAPDNTTLLYEYEVTEDTALIGDIFTETTTLLQKIVNFFVTAIQTIISLFWISGTGLTIYGKLFLIPAGFSVFYKVMKWVGRLIRIR